jgi:hypothetical protein
MELRLSPEVKERLTDLTSAVFGTATGPSGVGHIVKILFLLRERGGTVLNISKPGHDQFYAFTDSSVTRLNHHSP